MLRPKFAQIITKGIDFELSYSIPPHLSFIDIGFEVTIDLRNKIERGWVVGLTDEPPLVKEKTKSDKNHKTTQENLFQEKIATKINVKEILSAHQAFLKQDLDFFRLVSKYYACPLFEVFENAVPKKIEERHKYGIRILDTKNAPTNNNLKKPLKPGTKQDILLKIIQNKGNYLSSDLVEELDPILKKVIPALLKKNLIEKIAEDTINVTQQINAPTATVEQQQAIKKITESILNKTYSPYLLHGITGSGKTEVYIKTIEAALNDGGSALLVVPEIALTPQLLSRLANRLTNQVAVLHSQIGSGVKWSEWNKIINSKKKIIVGARSAIFAPIPNLRLIIVDEEHESSYKQAEGLRYNARDLALIKGKEKNCTVVLGSATPSFESLSNAMKKNFDLLELTTRATNANLPEIKVVDIKNLQTKFFASPNITTTLYDEIKNTLEKGEQIILFYNRRGFASYLQCTSCGKPLECSDCSITLTYYQSKNKISCHYCGKNKPAPEKCPSCINQDTHLIEDNKKHPSFGKLVPRGSGTEKIYDEIKELFPDTIIDRMDRDSVNHKDSIEKILSKMQSGETKILIGTQMLAKGHDLPSVTLVGIIDADVGLHFPDFRSSERTFQLIVQASGRAGRGSLPGKVIIQTRESDHPTIVAAVTNRFKAFARYEIEFRKKLGYPPDGRLARIIISSPNRQEASIASKNLVEFLENLKNHTQEFNEDNKMWKVLGPSPAPIEKLRGRYRWHLLIKSKSANKLSSIARDIKLWKDKTKDQTDLRVVVDIDPVDML